MIQRIQTLFLLLSIICLGLYLYFPLIIYTLPTGTPALIENPIIYKGYALGYNMPINGIRYIVFVNLILAASAAGFALLNVFLFKKRKLQMLFCWFTLLLIAASLIFVLYAYLTKESRYDDFAHKIIEADVYLTPWFFVGVAAAVLQLLAYYFIKKDEELIKSLDRLR